ncbi:MAG TPA: DUF2203 family protein [Thermoanaerobaculia bacterium]|nr:DUF2203 family protein [Thermoanaerobaculia bacterium]
MDTARTKRLFTYEEAVALLPEAKRRTEEAVAELESLMSRQGGEELVQENEVSSAYQLIVARWAESILDLGIEVKGLWLIDFDSGSGYYCWHYPEPSLQFFHGYEEGFGGRIRLN